jgi:hypothetical protein
LIDLFTFLRDLIGSPDGSSGVSTAAQQEMIDNIEAFEEHARRSTAAFAQS